MADEETVRSLNHFAGFRLRPEFWGLDADHRGQLLAALPPALGGQPAAFEVYQLYPTSPEADVLLWAASPLADDGGTRDFLRRYAQATLPLRPYMEPRFALWGYTAASVYSKARSAQEMDPFDPDRRTYLAIYPFVKTEDWYLLSRDARQGMMNEHIRLGKQYSQIRQLLLYSFGVQDQEFVVVYEMEDLPLFSKLVQELRSTDARRYTRRDSPLYTGVRQPAEDPFGLWTRA
jgi:chlorite dismutase